MRVLVFFLYSNKEIFFQLMIAHNFSKQRKAAEVNKRLETRGGGNIYPDGAC